MYVGARLGPGPRDGLMTGASSLTGRSVRLVRTLMEIVVLAAGWLLGGSVGVGTVLYALAVGPVTQYFLPRFTYGGGDGLLTGEGGDPGRRTAGEAGPGVRPALE